MERKDIAEDYVQIFQKQKNIRKEYVPIFSPGKARRDIANIVINPWQRATGVSRDAFLNNLSPPARWGEREFKRKKPKPFHFHFHKMGEAEICKREAKNPFTFTFTRWGMWEFKRKKPKPRLRNYLAYC